MAGKIKIKNGALVKLQKQLGMDSLEEVKKTIMAVHGSLALDGDDKDAKDEDDKAQDNDDKAEDEDDVEIVEDSDDDKAKDEEKQTQAEKDNESEAMRLKEREKRESKDRDRDRNQAEDSATIEQRAVARVTRLFKAKEEVKHVVGDIACDSADDLYRAALKQMGHDVTGVHPSAYEAMFSIAKKGSTIAQDSAPKTGTASKEVANKLSRFG